MEESLKSINGGSLGAVLLVFAMINDSILLHVNDWNLLWYVGVVGDILGWQGHDSQRKSQLRITVRRN
jgi:hypothetical protein